MGLADDGWGVGCGVIHLITDKMMIEGYQESIYFCRLRLETGSVRRRGVVGADRIFPASGIPRTG